MDEPGGDFPDLASLDALPNNLPCQLTSFVGRGREIAQALEALDDTRLLTLTGAGGCGKTRLALQLAADVLHRFPDGGWWVELAPLAEESLVGAAIAEVLGVRPLPGMTSLAAACAHLASRRALLILDNCEHLLAACAGAVEAILHAAPEVIVLATSRAPLDEQALLRRVSVFAGGFTLDAVEAVCSGEGIDRYSVLDLLCVVSEPPKTPNF